MQNTTVLSRCFTCDEPFDPVESGDRLFCCGACRLGTHDEDEPRERQREDDYSYYGVNRGDFS